jgi:citrate lyase subunit beta/citryl-CoA lyase
MIPRSLLFVPGDSDRKLARGPATGADALILDLEDAVAPEHKAAARSRVREFLLAHPAPRGTQLWVRINPFDTPESRADLAAVVEARPDGIMQPKINGADDVISLGNYLEACETRLQLPAGQLRILPLATETPAALFALGDLARCSPRLLGLTWGAEDLSAAVGATGNREADGRWTQPYQLARSLCLFGASAAGVPAFDTLYVELRNATGLRAACLEGSRDGFVGKLAIHPDQVAIINECFMPSPEQLAHARQVVELFAAHPGVAALSLAGKMLDIPHLRQAQKILARAR